MPITLKCYTNCDDVLLVWHVNNTPNSTIPGCLGFAIEIKKQDGSIETLHNLKGFEADKPQTGETQATTKWPLQTYMWNDHTILHGTQVQFRVTAMLGLPNHLNRGDASAWSDIQTLSPQAGAKTSAFFNRGFILSQFVSRYAKEHNLTTMPALKTALSTQITSPLMQFLAGELGSAIRGILQEARHNPKIELYCTLFELDLDDLIEGLSALKGRAHVILGNGSVKHHEEDENVKAATRLTQAGVDLHRRMVAPTGLAHNKSVVIVIDGKPFGVWTGSTNWTLTGLHTQINNGIAIENRDIAQSYLDQWTAIKNAESSFTHALKAANASAKGPYSLQQNESARVWFTPNIDKDNSTPGGADISDLIEVVNGAKEGILFVLFMPGQEPLNTILKRQQEGLYVRGVVSTLPMGSRDNPSGTYQIMTGTGYKEYKLEVVQPQGVGAVGDFLSTFTRQDFLSGMGFAITHSKVLVIDPFGNHPVVVTGSHNMSASASGKNDENLVIIENCPELARAYAVNCMSVYKYYRWPASQHDAKQPGNASQGYLSTADSWQNRTQNPSTIADLKFWMNTDA
jgi:phosphatidylserine/phosphatidylglycerophosphate/cardiolipin synthase-like enzyme